MPLPKKNILANLTGSIWTVLIGIVFVPIYIKYMGIEAYGLIGLFAIIQSLIIIVDRGLSITMNREMARLSALTFKEDEMHNISKTVEIIYWAMALIIGTLIVTTAPLIANKWLNTVNISSNDTSLALRLMGISMMFQWPGSAYSGGLSGLQKQVLLNKINIAASTIRALGAIIVLILFSNKIMAFFTWQVVISALHTLTTAYFFKKALPLSGCQKIDFIETFKKIWRFSAGVSGTTLMAMLFIQADKIILSKILSLEIFGYYALASLLAGSVYNLTAPVSLAVMPRFTELIQAANYSKLINTYHSACKLVSLLIMPAISVGILFSHEILLLWTKDIIIADNTYIVLSLLLTGSMLNALCHIPYYMQLASGWTKLGFYSGTVSALLVVPLMIIASIAYGAIGAAAVLIILNIGYILIVIPIMHRKILRTEMFEWYMNDISLPLIVSFSIAGIWRFISYSPVFYNSTIILIVSAISSGYLVAMCMSADIRSLIKSKIYAWQVQ